MKIKKKTKEEQEAAYQSGLAIVKENTRRRTERRKKYGGGAIADFMEIYKIDDWFKIFDQEKIEIIADALYELIKEIKG